MKNFLLTMFCAALACLGLAGPTKGQMLFDNFEDVRQLAYVFSNGTLVQPTGNPAAGGANPSANVGQYTRNAASQYDVIVVNLPITLLSVADYRTGTKKMRIKVYSANPGTQLDMYLQNGATASGAFPTGRHSQYSVVTTQTNAWEELSFNFNYQPDPGVSDLAIDQVILQFAPNSFTGGLFYFDDLILPERALTEPAGTGGQLLDDFDNPGSLIYTYASGNLSAGAANPAPVGLNTSPLVLAYQRSAGSQFDVVIADIPGSFNDVTPYLTGARKMRMKVFSSKPGTTLQLFLQNKALATGGFPAGRHSLYQGTTTATNQWETVLFSFVYQPDNTVPNTGINQFSLLVAPNTFTNTQLYFDDIRGPEFTAPTAPPLGALYDDFETIRNVTYPGSSGTLAPAANPSASGVNTSSAVARYNRSNALFDVIEVNIKNSLENLALYRANTKRFTIKFFSQYPGTVVQLTLQNKNKANGGNYPTGRHSEYTATTTRNSEWETLTFSFTNQPDGAVGDNDANQALILISPGVVTTNTYYFDELKGAQTVVGEQLYDNYQGGGTINYSFINGTLSEINNPSPNVINSSARVGQYIRSTAAFDVIIVDPGANLQDITPYRLGTKKMSLKVFSTTAGARVRISLENLNLALPSNYPTGRHSEYEAFTTKTNQWETLTFDFTNQPDPSVLATRCNRLVLFFDPGNAASSTYIIDDFYGPVYSIVRWTGAASTDWTTPANWSNNAIPGINDNVVFSAAPARNLVLNATASCASMTINNGAIVTVGTGGNLSIYDDFNNESTLIDLDGTISFVGSTPHNLNSFGNTLFNNLTISTGSTVLLQGPVSLSGTLQLQGTGIFNLNNNVLGSQLTLLSTAAGTARIATLPNPANLQNATNVTVQRYLVGLGWHLAGTPVQAQGITDWNDDITTKGPMPGVSVADPNPEHSYIFALDQSRTEITGPEANGWFVPTTSAITHSQGYRVWMQGPRTLDNTGTVFKGPINQALAYTASGAYPGWHLLSNPYPSPIAWDLVTRTNTEAGLFTYNPAISSYQVYIPGGNYAGYPTAGVSINGGGNVLAANQGYLVHALGSGASVAFTESMKTTGGTFYRTEAGSNQLRLTLAQGDRQDETLLRFMPPAIRAFEPEIDARKINGSQLNLAVVPELGLQLAIHTQGPPADGERLQLRAIFGIGTHALLPSFEELDSSISVFLVDNYLTTEVLLSSGQAYTFQVGNSAGDAAPDRFVLRFGRTITSTQAKPATKWSLWPSPATGGYINVTTTHTSLSDVSIVWRNALGTVVKTDKITGQLTQCTTPRQAGAYFITISTPEEVFSQRVVVQP